MNVWESQRCLEKSGKVGRCRKPTHSEFVDTSRDFSGLPLTSRDFSRLLRRLKEPDGVNDADASPDLRSEVFDERQMIAIELVVQVEGVDRKDMRVVFLRVGV